MSSKNRRSNADRSKLRMDEFKSDKLERQKNAPSGRREIDKVIKKARRDGSQNAFWTKKVLEVEEKEPDRWCHSGFKKLYLEGSKSKSKSPAAMYSPSAPTSPGRYSRHSPSPRAFSRSASKDGSATPPRRSRTDKFSTDGRTRSPAARSPKVRSPRRKRESPHPRNSKPSPEYRSRARRERHRAVGDVSPVRVKTSPRGRYRASRSPVVISASPSPSRRSVTKTPPNVLKKYKRRARTKDRYSSSLSVSPVRKSKVSKNVVLSSTDCSDSNCSMCRLDGTSAKEKQKVKRIRPTSELKKARIKPRTTLTSSSRYARSRSLSIADEASPPIDQKLSKHRKKSKKEKKKKSRSSSALIPPHAIKQESVSDSESENQSSHKRPTLSERFGKMAKLSQKKEMLLDLHHQRSFQITASENHNHHRLDDLVEPLPLMRDFLDQPPVDGMWDSAMIRYTVYKERGYLEDLSFPDYLKWEEWWFRFRDWLDGERLARYP